MKQNPALSTFLGGYALCLSIGLCLCLSYDQGYFVRLFDSWHHPALDKSMIWLTYLGDGAVLALGCLVCCLFRYKYAIILTVIGLFQLVGVTLFKQVVFGRTPRPLSFLEADTLPNLIASIEVHHWYSFPSGHTVTAFGICFFVALVNEKRSVAVLALLAAIGISLTRVYLAQHFLIDVVAGSTLGVFITGFCYYGASQIPAFWQHRVLNLPYAQYEAKGV